MADAWDRERLRKLLVRGFGWWLCVGLWTAALLTTEPAQAGEAVVPPALRFPAAKCLHISAYAFLAVFLSWLPLGRWGWLLLAFLSLHAAGTEYFQQFVPGRHGMALDVLIDHAGLLLGLALTWKHWLPQPSGCPFSRDPKGSAEPRAPLRVAAKRWLSSPGALAATEDTSTEQSPPRQE